MEEPSQAGGRSSARTDKLVSGISSPGSPPPSHDARDWQGDLKIQLCYAQ